MYLPIDSFEQYCALVSVLSAELISLGDKSRWVGCPHVLAEIDSLQSLYDTLQSLDALPLLS